MPMNFMNFYHNLKQVIELLVMIVFAMKDVMASMQENIKQQQQDIKEQKVWIMELKEQGDDALRRQFESQYTVLEKTDLQNRMPSGPDQDKLYFVLSNKYTKEENINVSKTDMKLIYLKSLCDAFKAMTA